MSRIVHYEARFTFTGDGAPPDARQFEDIVSSSPGWRSVALDVLDAEVDVVWDSESEDQ
jgi:hypothetical protein